MQLNNILVAVDGSANSDRALDFALGLSEKFGAALAILNVSESLSMNAVPAEQICFFRCQHGINCEGCWENP